MLELLTADEITQVKNYIENYEEMMKDGECIYHLQDQSRLEGTTLEVIACTLIIHRNNHAKRRF